MKAILLIFLCHSSLASEVWESDALIEVTKVIDCDQFEKNCIVEIDLKCFEPYARSAGQKDFSGQINIHHTPKKLAKGDSVKVNLMKIYQDCFECWTHQDKGSYSFVEYKKCTETQIKEQIQTNQFLEFQQVLDNLQSNDHEKETVQNIINGGIDKKMRSVLESPEDFTSFRLELAVVYLYLGPNENLRKEAIAKVNAYTEKLNQEKQIGEKYGIYLVYDLFEQYDKKYSATLKNDSKAIFLETTELKNKIKKNFSDIIKQFKPKPYKSIKK